jgi:phosphate transport system substrate-binding protein
MKTNRKNILAVLFAIVLGGLMAGCEGGGSSTKKGNDTPTQGEITIAADESLQPVVDAQREAFQMNYKKAKVNAMYKPETQAINEMLNDRARLVVITRELTDKEKETFKKDKTTYRSAKVAIDAPALIVNKANKDTMLTVDEIGDLFLKKKTKWSEIGLSKGPNEDVVIVFDNANSSNLTYMLNKYGIKDPKGLPIYSANGNKDVIEYVKTHKNALGIIGVNWVSDSDNERSQKFNHEVNVVSIAQKPNPSPTDYYHPFGYNIYYTWYPFRRDVYLVLKEPWMGMGSGFMSYVTSDPGQLVFLKAGLIPATRQVIVRTVKTGQ